MDVSRLQWLFHLAGWLGLRLGHIREVANLYSEGGGRETLTEEVSAKRESEPDVQSQTAARR